MDIAKKIRNGELITKDFGFKLSGFDLEPSLSGQWEFIRLKSSDNNFYVRTDSTGLGWETVSPLVIKGSESEEEDDKEGHDEEEKYGFFKGYASVYGNVDNGNDVMAKGVFKKSLEARGEKFPILANHDWAKQVGFNLKASENDHGLYVEGALDIKDNPNGVEKYSLMKMAEKFGVNVGLSVGFTVDDYEEKKGLYTIKEATLWEYSIVTFPMNEKAMVTGVMDEEDDEDMDEKEILKSMADCLKEARTINQ